MVTIRSGNEPPTPPTEWMEGLPENAETLVILSLDKVLAVFEKVEVNGKTEYVETILDAGILRAIHACAFNTAVSLSKR